MTEGMSYKSGEYENVIVCNAGICTGYQPGTAACRGQPSQTAAPARAVCGRAQGDVKG